MKRKSCFTRPPPICTSFYSILNFSDSDRKVARESKSKLIQQCKTSADSYQAEKLQKQVLILYSMFPEIKQRCFGYVYNDAWKKTNTDPQPAT